MNEFHTPRPPGYDKPVLSGECCVTATELAQAYVCPQKLDGMFPPEEGLRKGTIFPGLYKPYEGRRQK